MRARFRCSALAVLLVVGYGPTGNAQPSLVEGPVRLSRPLLPAAATATSSYPRSEGWSIPPLDAQTADRPRSPAVLWSQAVECDSFRSQDACVGQVPWGSVVGGTAGVGAALLYCSGRSCDAAIFAVMFLGGYIGSELGKLIQCGLPPLAPSRPTPLSFPPGFTDREGLPMRTNESLPNDT